MKKQTHVNSIKIKPKAMRLMETTEKLIEFEPEISGLRKYLSFDELVRNLSLVGCLVLVVVALRNSTLPQAQSVFGAIQSAAGMEWDESLGKLSFVNGLLPQEIQEVWNATSTAEVKVPLVGEIVHSWSADEPYLLIRANASKVFAVDGGEVMSISHGPDEEVIVRIRHDSGYETIYGNLSECNLQVGDYVGGGDVVGTLLEGKELAFELRRSGKSIKPVISNSTLGQ